MSEQDNQRGPKFRRRAEARPDEVLDAALDLFITKGFAATRVEDIARQAGLSKGAVYLYFPSKEALMEGLVRRAVAPIASLALHQLEGVEGDPRLAISATLRMVAGKLADPRLIAIPRLIMREVVQFPELAEMYRKEVLEQIIPVAIGLINRGIAEGYLRPVDPELTVRSIVGPIALHLILAEVFRMTPADGLAMDRLMDNHLAILFDGLSLPERAK
ncbi:TetR family transcriptional regulator [Youhaiella tibetensis]|jgi:AcrR family transcriptional regulator|uniref:TetR/AcrR family transcriptional regulator n=1 Tax=Paradevosia tibetensis TaxID=1447062 RepID=A0A5B9DSA0_9HYPH|nr:TetR/AcrR family transcriptional regulator [Youhaiella tibetensis]QEE22311.1 TetR/AcrR family transcriptional regulator [Youhaiella tibetensis]GGF43358.1 TetR family transcriptional regulator [Youhaiella tibetensis]